MVYWLRSSCAGTREALQRERLFYFTHVQGKVDHVGPENFHKVHDFNNASSTGTDRLSVPFTTGKRACMEFVLVCT